MKTESEKLSEILANQEVLKSQNERLIAINLASNTPKMMCIRDVALVLGIAEKTVRNRIAEGFYEKLKSLVLWRSVIEYEQIFGRRKRAERRSKPLARTDGLKQN